MTILDCFKPQIEKNEVVTKEIYSKLKNKEYHNGRKVKIGDKMLYALLVDRVKYNPIDYTQSPPLKKEEPSQSITMTLVVIHEDDINDYQPFDGYDNSRTSDRPPIISKIKKDEK